MKRYFLKTMGSWLIALIMLLASADRITAQSDTSRMKPEIDTYQAQGHTDARWDELVVEGFTLYYQFNYQEALSYLNKAYGLGCRDGLVLYRIAFCYFKLGLYDTATRYAEEAFSPLKKDYPEHYYNQTLYTIYSDCGQLTTDDEKAVEYYVKALNLEPADVSVRLNLAHRLIKLDRIDEAEQHINIVLEDYSYLVTSYGLGVAYNGLGQIYYKRQEYQEAVNALEKAWDYRQSGSDAWELALTYEALGDNDKAIKCWNSVIEIYGENSSWGLQAQDNLRRLQE